MFTISAYIQSKDGYQLVRSVQVLAPISDMKTELHRFERDITWKNPGLICKYIVRDKNDNILYVQPE